MTKTEKMTVEQLEAQAHALAQRTAELAKEMAQLEASVRRARGTRELAPQEKPEPINTEYSGREADVIATKSLYAWIKELVSARPMLFRDLVEATNAAENRIKGAIIRLQRDEVGLINLGNQYKALWFIPGEDLIKRLTRR